MQDDNHTYSFASCRVTVQSSSCLFYGHVRSKSEQTFCEWIHLRHYILFQKSFSDREEQTCGGIRELIPRTLSLRKLKRSRIRHFFFFPFGPTFKIMLPLLKWEFLAEYLVEKICFCSFIWKNSKEQILWFTFFFHMAMMTNFSALWDVSVSHTWSASCPLPIIDLSQPLTFKKY